jgi:hypothetical protein
MGAGTLNVLDALRVFDVLAGTKLIAAIWNMIAD